MIHGKTSSGFTFELDDNVMDNMELVDQLSELNSENPYAISKIIMLLLGEGQRKALYDHLRTEDGRVPVMQAAKEINDIFNAAGSKGKN